MATDRSPSIVACTGEALRDIRIVSPPVYCWLYFTDQVIGDFRELIEHIVSFPSTHIAISGPTCALIHDQVDELLIELGQSDITTTWHEGADREAAWDFVNLDFNPNRAACRLVAVISQDVEEALGKLSELIRLCEAAVG
jgi:hypothetical protein